jgi:hypothetical protein
MRTRFGKVGNWLGLSLVVAMAGCATAEPPKGQMATAEAAIDRAQESEATSYAPVEMQRAREEMRAARSALDKEKYVEARRQAEKAAVDARLAEARAQSEQTKKIVQELRATIETLRQEIQRRQNQQ